MYFQSKISNQRLTLNHQIELIEKQTIIQNQSIHKILYQMHPIIYIS